jgi:hypothetical protein
VDALQDAEKIGSAIRACPGISEMNDGSIPASRIGYEWIGTDGAYSPEEISV